MIGLLAAVLFWHPILGLVLPLFAVALGIIGYLVGKQTKTPIFLAQMGLLLGIINLFAETVGLVGHLVCAAGIYPDCG